MSIDLATVERIAHLARLEFDEATKLQMLADMNEVLEFVEKLNELNTDGIQPLIYMNEEYTVLRKDEVHHDLQREEALQNAPKRDTTHFRVAKVIDK